MVEVFFIDEKRIILGNFRIFVSTLVFLGLVGYLNLLELNCGRTFVLGLEDLD